MTIDHLKRLEEAIEYIYREYEDRIMASLRDGREHPGRLYQERRARVLEILKESYDGMQRIIRDQQSQLMEYINTSTHVIITQKDQED